MKSHFHAICVKIVAANAKADMAKTNAGGFIFCMLTLFLCGAVIFLIGFFPVASNSSDRTVIEIPTNLDGFILNPPSQKYAQTILLLVDALRHDFPTDLAMPFSYGRTCAHLKLRVGIPTVTMPRLKSLTTGTLSNFIDILLNLGSAEYLDASLLHSLRDRGDVTVFAGDRTWVNLFPSEFRRKEPNLDSFFVHDFYEGDKNVTRALTRELQNHDWSLLILHYLGLDHIGHVEGSASPKMPGKLKEMDNVVEQIYNAKHFRDTLLLLTGDHGMRNGGGHGGSTIDEIYVPLLFFKENCTKKSTAIIEYDQIDLAPTLAILLSINIPKPSIGCLIPELLEELTLEEQLYAYYYNAHHLIHKATVKYDNENVIKTAYFKWFMEAKSSHKQFLNAKRSQNAIGTVSFQNAKMNYMRVAREVSSILAESLVTFHYDWVVIGLTLTTVTTAYTLIFVLLTRTSVHLHHPVFNVGQVLLILTAAVIVNVWCHYMHYIVTGSGMQSIFLTLPIVASIFIVASIIKILLQVVLTVRPCVRLTLALPLPLLTCFVFHTLSLASSSFIEEEHQTWYYLGASILVMLFVVIFHYNVRNARDDDHIFHIIQREAWQMRLPLLMLSLVALIRKLNQTGDKWRNLLDFGDVLNRSKNKPWLSLFFVIGLIALLLRLRRINTSTQMIANVIAALAIYCFRGFSGAVSFLPVKYFTSTLVLPIFWICICVTIVIRYKSVISKKNPYGYEPKTNLVKLLQTNLSCSFLVAALLHKPHNVILLPSMLFILDEAYKLCDRLYPKAPKVHGKSFVLVHKTVLTIFVANMFYFYQGNSNSLATIDLNPGFTGQSSYNPLIVGTFVALNTYSAHINAFLCLVLHIFSVQCSSLPMRQEKEQTTNTILVQSTEQDLQLVISVYAASTMLPVAVYLCLMVIFRFHIFIFTVFSPKVLYECVSVVIFYLNFTLTNLYLKIIK